MKKIFFSFLVFFCCCSFVFADCACDNKKNSDSLCKKDCAIEDDEYCVYNQCYFDRRYRTMKKSLCLDECQEKEIDMIYKDFKADMEMVCEKYTNEKDKLLQMIANHQCYKNQEKILKGIKSQVRECYKDFISSVKCQLNSCQKKEFKKIVKSEKKTIKLIVKYGAVYKFPCLEN